ncbi:putative terminase, endonuclease subunit [Escherichia coli]|nr:putative terminase, endonuclease subunit [Escherichia coli]
MRAHAAGESVDIRLLTDTLELTAAADMPDEVRAKLHKITGLFLRDGGDAPVRWRTCNVRHSSTVRQASKRD